MSDIREPGQPTGRVTGAAGTVRYYKKDFWKDENLKFSRPWYRLEKSARIISQLASGKECALLDIGCGPAALMSILPANIHYYGIDIAIQRPAPHLIEADIVQSRISFANRKFDLVVAQGLFEYLGQHQEQKFAEIAQLMRPDAYFVTTFTNFAHRKTYIYEPFNNVQSIADFRSSLARYFRVERVFPASHNWKHAQPSRGAVKAANMYVSFSVPLISSLLAVEYFFICSPLKYG